MSYICPACHGNVSVPRRNLSLDAVKLVHESTCPAVLRLGSKKK